ncbi:hypothetical protein ACHAWF_004614 [Thalassiosira exigua]
MLFGSDRVGPYVGELGVITTFDLLLKLGTSKAAAPATSFETWDDVKSAFGIREAALRRRKREAEIALHLRERVEGYDEGYLAPGAFAEGAGRRCGGSRGGTGTTARCSCWPSVPRSWRRLRPFLGYRSSLSVARAVARTAKESLTALYESTTGAVREDLEGETGRRRRPDAAGDGTKKPELNKELLKDNLSDAIPTILEMAWAINYFWRAGLEATEGGDATLAGAQKGGGGGDADVIKARVNAALAESLRRGMEKGEVDDGQARSVEM